MTIKLPKRFNEILSGEYRAFVDNAINKYKDIYLNNKLEFFPDYTDHGINHIEEVLETAENIIDENSFKFLNEKDISVLIISILLHDIGMQISREGMKKIFSSSFDKWRISFFDTKQWKDEWLNYFQEAKRFNDEQLKNLFGTSEQNINEPNLENLDNYSIKLYGEFLRRHHHRLAHEIALSGFPTQIGQENITIHADNIEKDILDLAGLVARSHGMKVRKAIDYLEKKFQDAWQAPYDIKAVFLMVVLRIADYLQIHSSRASKVILKSKRFDSPISKKEWEKHNSVKDINIKTADPERIFIIARPENSAIYLELEKLFEDIQAELDTSWAILGETYGKDDELKNLKIRFRRIRSVFDDKDAFDKTVDYIPEKIFFNADPSLLKLLIGPLYGEDPKYGIRELLQNSIDAVKEREYLTGIQGKVMFTLNPVKKGKARYELIIEDTGIGMSKNTIINYFFKAGASFRKSMSWKKNFIDDNEVKIQKTGRFGVGVLAVFLLGDDFELWTKYYDTNSEGYYCKASLSMTQVELKKEDCNVGTKIKILLKESVNSLINMTLKEIETRQKNNPDNLYYNSTDYLLQWFTWYVMDKPKIEYSIDKSLEPIFKFIPSTMLISSTPDNPSPEWRSFTTAEYRSIHWTIDLISKSDYYYDDDDEKNDLKIDNLACNGFKIKKGYNFHDYQPFFKSPKLSIFDNNANFPLSLSRDYIQGDSLPFEDELKEFICIEIINTILDTSFTRINPYYIPNPNFLTLLGQVDLSQFLVVIGDEFTILNSSIFSTLKFDQFCQFWLKNTKEKKYDFNPESAYQASIVNYDSITFYKQILEAAPYNNDRYYNWLNLNTASRREDKGSTYYISSSKLEYLFQGKRLTQSYKDAIAYKKLHNNWSRIITKGDVEHSSQIKKLESLNNQIYPLIINRYISSTFNDSDILIKTWVKHLGSEWTFPIEKNKRPELIKQKKLW